MGWLIALGIIALLAMLPLGVSMRYQQDGCRVWIQVGPARFLVYPPKERPEKKRKKPEPEQKPAAPYQTSGRSRGGSWKGFLPLVQVLLDFLKDLKRKIRVSDLQLHVTMAGEDPCDLAINYGRMNAAMAALLAHLEQWLVIKKRSVWLRCDFEAEQTVVDARLDVTITVAGLLALAARYGVRTLKAVRSIKKQQESGVQQ